MQTPSLFILSEWSAQTKLYTYISITLSGVEESKHVSDSI